MSTETAVSIFEAPNALAVLTDAAKFNRFYEEMKRETDAHVPDLSTDKGRKAIASLAFKVARTKTAIDEAGKKLNEDARKQIAKVDEARREIRDKLDALRDEVRAPLTAWEIAEEKRLTYCKATIQSLHDAAVVQITDDEETVADRLATVTATEIDPVRFGEFAIIASGARANALLALEAAAVRLAKEEADRLELERLRQEASERVEAEEAARIAAEQKAQREAEERAMAEAAARAEEEAAAQAAREKANEEARVEAAARDAERRARAEAEAEATAARAHQDRLHAEALAAEKRRADEAEAAQRAETARAAAAEIERQAEAKRVTDEEARRAADREHRATIMGAAKEGLMQSCGLSEAAAKKVVLGILAGNVPHVSVRF